MTAKQRDSHSEALRIAALVAARALNLTASQLSQVRKTADMGQDGEKVCCGRTAACVGPVSSAGIQLDTELSI